MDSQPLVSIGALNYNNANYVIETLESIKAQTYPNIELIIVDDCSTDDSPKLIEKWLKNYNKPFKFIKNEKNRGVVCACNTLLNNINGKYISIIATDDIMLPEKLSIQVQALELTGPDVASVYSDAYLIDENSSPLYGWFIQRYKSFLNLPEGNIYDELMNINFIPAMSCLHKRESINSVGDFDESLVFEDYDMWLRLARNHNFIVSNYPSVKYRCRAGGLTNTIKNWLPSLIRIYFKHIDKSIAAKEQLISIAKRAYLERDIDSLKIIRERKSNINSRIINAILMLNNVPIDRKIGLKLLNILSEKVISKIS